MAEDNQDMEMEDILSSIKNILEEDEQKQALAVHPAAEVDVLDDVLNASSEVDDILELSPEMRIPEETQPEPPASAEIASDPIAEITAEPAIDPFSVNQMSESDNTSGFKIGVEDFESDSVFEADYQESTSEIIPEPVAEVPAEAEELTVIPEENAVQDSIYEVEAEPEEVVEAEITAEPERTFEQPAAEPEIELEAEPEAEEIVETQPAVEPEQIPVYEPQQETVVVETASEEKKPAETEDAVDVSANIISNFAKMFSHEEPAAAIVETPVPVISAPGNTDKTLEEFVLEAITKVIGKEISSQWNNGAEFKAFAEAEIIRQTKEWLNDNLPLLVEKVVKQEIERVIAKVGS